MPARGDQLGFSGVYSHTNQYSSLPTSSSSKQNVNFEPTGCRTYAKTRLVDLVGTLCY